HALRLRNQSKRRDEGQQQEPEEIEQQVGEVHPQRFPLHGRSPSDAWAGSVTAARPAARAGGAGGSAAIRSANALTSARNEAPSWRPNASMPMRAGATLGSLGSWHSASTTGPRSWKSEQHP